MDNLQEYMAGFRLNYEKFLVGCDAQETENAWPVDELGEMDVYFANDLACVIIRLIAADGVFADAEVDFLNSALGFDYTVDELKAVYKECGDKITDLFNNELGESVNRLESVNPALAETYKQMMTMIGKIVIESDGIVTEKEKEAAKELISLLA